MELKSRTELSNLNDILERMPQDDIDILNKMMGMLRKYEEMDRNCIFTMLMDRATETHTEELSIGASIVINKIVVHYDCDEKILESVIAGLRKGIAVGLADRKSKAGRPH